MKISTLLASSTVQDADKFVISLSTDGNDTQLVTMAKLVEILKDSGGSGSGAEVSTGSDMSALPLTADTSSSFGQVVTVGSSTSSTEIAHMSADANLPFGLYSVIVRAKVTANSSSNAIFTMEAYNGDTLLKSYDVKENDFYSANTWVSIGLGVDYQGTARSGLNIKLQRKTYSGSASLSIDYIQIMPAPVAVNALD